MPTSDRQTEKAEDNCHMKQQFSFKNVVTSAMSREGLLDRIATSIIFILNASKVG